MRGEDFDAFARTSLPALGRYAVVLTGNRDDAQDLVQDTLVRLARAWPSVRDDGNPLAYAKTTMVRLHVNGVRRALHWRRLVATRSTSDRIDGGYGRTDDRAVLLQAMRSLSPLQQAAIVLTYFDDRTDDAIGVVLHRRPGSVRALRHRALARMRSVLEDGDSGGESR